ncbi:Hsp20/alpha crystallin family protein [Cytobacillus sp. S13-E01]|uniref:Hsp20/alpha crystallin family protein n=1 Tax=Cytobacillus sp. S13-E01 TaxID=3031326 RepID=UPI0023D8B7B0|nr:Hsp20/alpha crystallin family protein [Cytobacillus sp. S13-E01]MDF0728786.1 Hsp20/alpha crystallin family protein [Cytobacillus sp. S13-E01]
MNMNQFKKMGDWRKQWDQFFGDEFFGEFEPMFKANQTQLNLYKSDNEVLVVISVPGLEHVDQVDVFAHYQTLEVKGTVNLKFRGFTLVEEGIFQGTFERVVELPFPIREDRVDASYHNGLLIIHLHRLIPDDSRKKISVKKIED